MSAKYTPEQLDNVAEAPEEKFRENYLLFQLAFLSHKFSTEFHAFLREKGVSPSKWRVLVNVMEAPGIRLTDLAKKTMFEQSRVTKLVDQLCLEGYVLKTSGKKDRRLVNLNITRNGEKMLLPLISQAKQHETQILDQLDEVDAQQLKKILSKLTKTHS